MQNPFLELALQVKTVSEDGHSGVFEVEGLYGGYGLTVGTALRRALLSSIAGAAITQVKIRGVSHEFTTLPGIKEDIVELMLNLKKVRFRSHADEPQIIILKYRGEGEVTARDIKTTSDVELITPDVHLATLTTKQSELDAELTVERGLGYVPAEMRKTEKLPIGVIALDAIFSPVRTVFFTMENMRVGERTDYNRLRLTIETDGSLSPSAALHEAGVILRDHFAKIAEIGASKFETARVESSKAEGGAKEEKKRKTRKAKKDSASVEQAPDA